MDEIFQTSNCSTSAVKGSMDKFWLINIFTIFLKVNLDFQADAYKQKVIHNKSEMITPASE